MGETITGNLNRPPEPPKINSNPGTAAGSTPGKTRGNSPASAPGTGTAPTAGGSGTPAGKGTGTAEKEKLSGLASVTPPPVPDTPKKKQRKPRQSKKQDTNTSFNADQISALIVSLSSIVASRPGLEMFAITDIEAKQIATPLANMIAKSEQLKALSEHADAMALVTACFVIMAPRIMLYFNQQKEKKLKAAGGAKLVRTDEKAKTHGDHRESVRNTADAVSYDVSPLFAAIPAIGE